MQSLLLEVTVDPPLEHPTRAMPAHDLQGGRPSQGQQLRRMLLARSSASDHPGEGAEHDAQTCSDAWPRWCFVLVRSWPGNLASGHVARKWHDSLKSRRDSRRSVRDHLFRSDKLPELVTTSPCHDGCIMPKAINGLMFQPSGQVRYLGIGHRRGRTLASDLPVYSAAEAARHPA